MARVERDKITPAVPGDGMYQDRPEWMYTALFWFLAIVFFPMTLVLLWGARYRKWFAGGVAIDWGDEFTPEDWAEIQRAEEQLELEDPDFEIETLS